MRGLVSRLRSLVRGVRPGSRVDADMEEEFRLHMEMRSEDLQRAGMTPERALRRARLEFGSTERYREEGRAGRGLRLVDEVRADIRHAARSLRRTPAFTVVAVLTLALGVGANASMFGLVNATLLRPLPYPEPDRLVTLYQEREVGVPWRWSPPEFGALQSSLTSLSDVAAWYTDDMNLTIAGADPLRVRVELVSATYFPLLGITPIAGRGFVPADEHTTAPVAVIGHDMWTAQFSGEDVTGRVVQVNDVVLSIVGVAPRNFRGLSGRADVWVLHEMAPLIYLPGYLESDQRFLSIAARLRDDATIEQARSELAGAGARAVAAVAPAPDDPSVGPLRPQLMRLDEAARDPARVRAQLALSVAALGVLLIAAVNLSGLLLARAVARARETSIRAALGAGRARLLRHAVVEGAVLGVLGGLAGLLPGLWSFRLLAARTQDAVVWLPVLGEVGMAVSPTFDWRVVVFTLGAALGAAVLASLGAALRAGRADSASGLASGLADGSRGSSARIGSLRRPTVLTAAATVQVACSLLLLIGAALLVDGLRQLRSIDPGFEPRGVLAFTISPADTRYGGDAAAPLLTRVLERVRAVPGVQSATVSLCTPYNQCSRTMLYIDGLEQADAPTVGRHYVGPDHFNTLGIPLLRGRLLGEQDRAGAPRVAVINQTAARRYWPDTDPIGQRVWFGTGGGFASPDSLTEIVGIVGDVLYDTPGADIRPDFYTSYQQFTWAQTTVMVKAAVDPLTLVAPLRRAMADVDPNMPIHDVRTLEEWSDLVLSDQRFATIGLSAIATLGLILACLGIYGIMAWSVAQRRREIGIRHALGATAGQVARLVLGQGWGIVLLGIGVGVAASLALGRTLHALLPHAAPIDPVRIVIVAAILFAVATFACWLPARQASRVDPMRTIGEI